MNNKKFTIDQLTKSETKDPNSIKRLYKQNLMCRFLEIKSNEPRRIQKQFCNQLGFSDSTIKQYRDDNQLNSPYKRNNYKKRTSKRKSTTAT